MLNEWGAEEMCAGPGMYEEDDAVAQADREEMKNITEAERAALSRCLKALDASRDRDPKYEKVTEYLVERDWIKRGCIIFFPIF